MASGAMCPGRWAANTKIPLMFSHCWRMVSFIWRHWKRSRIDISVFCSIWLQFLGWLKYEFCYLKLHTNCQTVMQRKIIRWGWYTHWYCSSEIFPVLFQLVYILFSITSQSLNKFQFSLLCCSYLLFNWIFIIHAVFKRAAFTSWWWMVIEDICILC